MWIADNGVQVLGGHGFIREHPVEMWYRNARTLGVLEGTVALSRRHPMIDFELTEKDREVLDQLREEALVARRYARYYDENEHEFPPGRAARGGAVPLDLPR